MARHWVVLQEAPATAAEALQLAGLDWSVRKNRMKDAEDDRPIKIVGAANSKQEGYHGVIIREDTNGMLGVVGPSYQPFQNAAMARLIEPMVQEGLITIETAGSLFGGKRVWMLGKVVGSHQVIANNDPVVQHVLLAHGHDGSLAVRFGLTETRVVCQNTLSGAIGSKRSKLVKCLHTTNLEKNLEVLRDALNVGTGLFELSTDKYRELASKGVSRASLREYARVVIGADKDEKAWTVFESKKIGQIVGMAIEGRGNGGPLTGWTAYNGVTEYLTWEYGRSQETRINSLWFGENKDVNSRALDLACEMFLSAQKETQAA